MNYLHPDNLPGNVWIIFLFIFGYISGRYLLLSGIAWFICYSSRWKSIRRFKIQQKEPRRAQVVHELTYSFITILIFSAIGIIASLLYKNGHTTIYHEIGKHGWLYFGCSLPMLLILHDTYFYWTHRLLHTRWLYRRIHKIHHRSTNPTPLAAYSFHPLEAVVEALIIFPFILVFPVHIFVFFTFTLIVIFTNVVGHLGYEIFPEKMRKSVIGKILASSTHHNLHHQECTKNFGYYFTTWDRIMKTLSRFTYSVKPPKHSHIVSIQPLNNKK